MNTKKYNNMKQMLLACILIICMNSCSYGQDRSIYSTNNFPTRIFNDPEIQKLGFSLAAIERYYVDTINSSKLVEEAIISMLAKLDPHSYYLTTEEVRKTNESLQGNFEGIGIQFNTMTDTLYVVDVIKDGPSEKIGILAGDKIIYVNDTLIAGVKMRDTDIVSKLRGPKGTTVNVKILRKGFPQLLDFKIVRDKIPIYSLRIYYMIDKNIGYIRLDRFSATTHKEFKEAMAELQAQGMENLILDLQSNGGGFLNESIELANEFLSSGSLIVYTEGLNQSRDNYKANDSGSFKNGRLVIMVDEASASASEIVSGAVQDWDRGVIIGRRTFGKGMVQRPISFPDGSVIRLTSAYYYTPSGRSIQKPFTKGDSESYHREIDDRIIHGEMVSADSIHFSDSLKYHTLISNRTVYGGGGIMPDLFIPVDTTSALYIARTTRLFLEMVYSKGTINKYIQSFMDENRVKYKALYPELDSFKQNFTVSDNMFDAMMKIYIKDKTEELKEKGELKDEIYQLTEEQQTDLEKSKWLLLHFIKVNIAREIFSENESTQLHNVLFDTYNKAVEIISDVDKYNELLSR